VTANIVRGPSDADAVGMIISNEQARLALQSLQHTKNSMVPHTSHVGCAVSPSLQKRIDERLADLPETRHERVEQARADLACGTPTADDVADKMIGRIISDALR
jgi:hypothetical protein